MRKIKKMIKNLFTIVLFTIFLHNCSNLKDGFQSKRKNSTDEFLVEKKAPLVMPPNYNELPVPKSKKIEKKIEDNTIENLVKNNEIKGIESKEALETNKNLEESLLEKIKKN